MHPEEPCAGHARQDKSPNNVCKAPALLVRFEDLPSSETWFSGDRQGLPTPQAVRERAESQGRDLARNFRPKPVLFPELGLLVKWGTEVTSAEGQCLWVLRKKLKNEVPVPEIYGWTKDSDETFLYMELILAESLAGQYESLDHDDRSAICEQLSSLVAAWRRLKLSTGAPLLCQIGGQPLRDITFYDAGKYPAGPFTTLDAFHDFFAMLPQRKKTVDTNPRQTREELSGLSNDVAVVFTHADLDLSNILVSRAPDGVAQIVAIIDWHQSGWYPEPWEYLKAQAVVGCWTEWAKEWLPKVIKAPNYEYAYSWEYVSMSTI